MDQREETQKLIEHVLALEQTLKREMLRPTYKESKFAALKKCESIEAIMNWMRDVSWDLEAALYTINNALEIEPNDCKHGSCQDILSRLPVALVLHYGVSEEAFWDWDT